MGGLPTKQLQIVFSPPAFLIFPKFNKGGNNIMRNFFMDLIKRNLRVPAISGDLGNGKSVARQLDIALISAGFKSSKELLEYLGKLHPISASNIAIDILSAVREVVGDHVKHNVYFKDFPENVPDTEEFWASCIIDALLNPDSAFKVATQIQTGVINLLDLPKYGRYRHSYEEMLAAHEEFIPSVKDRATVLHLGKSLPEEALELYHQFAGSNVPLNEEDRKLLLDLAEFCISDPQPEKIPIRENKALINKIRLENEKELLADTPTDILRLACALSEGDVTLQEKTKFKSFSRKVRRMLLKALDTIIEITPEKLADVNQYREVWKRLQKNLHPYEYDLSNAHDLFAVARGDEKVRSIAARVEIALNRGNIVDAIKLLTSQPGRLFRSLDRILRQASEDDTTFLLEEIKAIINKVSGRVILSVREHFQNRLSSRENQSRIFTNSKGKAWVTSENREIFDIENVEKFFAIFDEEILNRLPEMEHVIVDRETLGLALPISQKNQASGFRIMPRGSTMPVANGILRFFIYWKQHHERTDFDLSALMLDENFQQIGQISWTNLRDCGVVHSGDITSAPNGASEFIDIELDRFPENCHYIIPQNNIFHGENFMEVEESFFGFMERYPEQKGKPFEAATVQMKSDVRGKGKVALPIVFIKDGRRNWIAKWLHLYLNGMPRMNRVEANKVSTTLLVCSVVEREYLTVKYLADLMKKKAKSFSFYEKGMKIPESPVHFIGLEQPEELPDNSKVYGLSNLQDLIPA